MACHPVKAIIACFIATALGGAGLLRSDHYLIILSSFHHYRHYRHYHDHYHHHPGGNCRVFQKGPKVTQNDVIVRKMTEIDLFHRFEAFLIAQGWLCHFPPVGGSERA